MRMNIDTQTHKIQIPTTISDERLDGMLNILHLIDLGAKKIILDFSRNTTISAAGYAIFCSIIDSANEHSSKIYCININRKEKTHLKIEAITEQSRDRKGFLQIENMNLIQDSSLNWGRVSSIAPEFIELIQQKFNSTLSEDELWIIKLILNELMQNSVDHSTSERYFIYAGFNKKTFEIGVIDRGVTIPAKLESIYNKRFDHEYLELSVKQGIGTRRNRPGGMGLYYLFEHLKDEAGKLLIISRNGQLRRHFNAKKVISKETKYRLRGTWCMGRIPIRREHDQYKK
jgi:anti-anti-sigma regulatory factor/anti-sigma regulatory factor (Ser/Thr protein kinase)